MEGDGVSGLDLGLVAEQIAVAILQLGADVGGSVGNDGAGLQTHGLGGGVGEVGHGAEIAQGIPVGDALQVGGAGDLGALGIVDGEGIPLHHGLDDDRTVDVALDGGTVVLDGDVQTVLRVKAEVVADQLGEAVLDVDIDCFCREGEPQAAVDVEVIRAGDAAAHHDGADVALIAVIGDGSLGGVLSDEGMGEAHAVPAVVGEGQTVLADHVVLVGGEDERIVVLQLAVVVVGEVVGDVQAVVGAGHQIVQADVLIGGDLDLDGRLGLGLGVRLGLGGGLCGRVGRRLGGGRSDGGIALRIGGVTARAGYGGQEHKGGQNAAKQLLHHFVIWPGDPEPSPCGFVDSPVENHKHIIPHFRGICQVWQRNSIKKSPELSRGIDPIGAVRGERRPISPRSSTSGRRR